MKKLNIKGFSHLEVLLTILVVVAVAGIGYFGYQRFQQNNSSKAAAGGWTSLGSKVDRTYGGNGKPTTVTAKACKTKLWLPGKSRVKVFLTRNNTTILKEGGVVLYKNSNPSGFSLKARSGSWWAGTMQQYEFTTSSSDGVQAWFYANSSQGPSSGQVALPPGSFKKISSLANC
jgi:Tfp pilus assembly protein PilV